MLGVKHRHKELLVGCLKWWWLPVICTNLQPSFSSIRMIFDEFIVVIVVIVCLCVYFHTLICRMQVFYGSVCIF